MQKSSFEYDKGTIEHRLQTPGGRGLAVYEAQLMFDKSDLEGKTVLDLGAGPELKFAKDLAESGIKAEVVSLSPDFSDSKYTERARNSLPGGELLAGVGQALPFRDEFFDRIFAFHVDEHISREVFFGFISEMARVLKKDGVAKLGPTLNIPGEWDPYLAILGKKELTEALDNNGVAVIREPIPEEIMPKTRIKDSFSNRFEESSYNIVLQKSSKSAGTA